MSGVVAAPAVQLRSFRAQRGVHCESTMVRNMWHHAGVDLSEAMIFGLGEGIDFEYHETPAAPSMPPMLTGRTSGSDLVRTACASIGIELVELQPDGSDAAEASARTALAADRVVGVTVDIFHLDHFASTSHFSAHCIAITGMDDAVAHVVDTSQQGGAQQLPVESLRRARASDEGYMPSPHRHFHLGEVHPDALDDLDALVVERSWIAIRSTAERMITERGATVGPAGIRRAAIELPTWVDRADDPGLWLADLGRFWRFAGTGGTNFRGLFCDFLAELEERCGDPDLPMFVEDFDWIRMRWVDVIDLLVACAHGDDHRGCSQAAGTQLLAIADAEERSFRRLLALADERVRGR